MLFLLIPTQNMCCENLLGKKKESILFVAFLLQNERIIGQICSLEVGVSLSAPYDR